MIVILDTNVWISALQFGNNRGNPARALEKAVLEDTIATCAEIQAEIVRVLTAKFFWTNERADDALRSLLIGALHVELQGTVRECRDAGDDIFLECAIRAKADLLIAGDKDLLVLGSYKQTRIVTPAEYVSGVLM